MLEALPTEIIQRILHYAFPLASHRRQPELYQLLCISRALYPIIQREIYASVCMSSDKQIEDVKWAVESAGATHLVRALRLGNISTRRALRTEMRSPTYMEVIEWARQVLPNLQILQFDVCTISIMLSDLHTITNLSCSGFYKDANAIIRNPILFSTCSITTLNLSNIIIESEDLVFCAAASTNLHTLSIGNVYVKGPRKKPNPYTEAVSTVMEACQTMARNLRRCKLHGSLDTGLHGDMSRHHQVADFFLPYCKLAVEVHLFIDNLWQLEKNVSTLSELQFLHMNFEAHCNMRDLTNFSLPNLPKLVQVSTNFDCNRNSATQKLRSLFSEREIEVREIREQPSFDGTASWFT